MGKILPGVFLTFENTKGGVGKSTITALLLDIYMLLQKTQGFNWGGRYRRRTKYYRKNA